MSSNNTIQILVDIKDALNGIKNVSTNLNQFITMANTPIRVNLDGTALAQTIKDMQAHIQSLQTQIKDMVTQTNNNITKSLGDFGFMLNTAATGFRMVGGSLGSLIDYSNQQEKATNSLRVALANLKQDTDANIMSYSRFASQMQNATNVADENVLGMLALATSMGIVEKKRKDAVQGAIGLSKAFASAGLSLETALKGITLATQGDYSMLQRYIPQLRDASSETEKMTILQNAMANGFNLATAEADSGAGAIQKLKNQFNDLKETLGDMIKSYIAPLVDILTGLFTFLNENTVVLKFLAGLVGFITTAIIANTIAIKAGIIATYESAKATLVKVATDAGLAASSVTLSAVIWKTVIAIKAQTAAFFASPFGWIVAGVGLLIGAISLFTRSLIKSKNDIDDQNQSMQNMGDISSNVTEEILSNRQKLDKAAEESYAKIDAIRQQAIDAEVGEYEQLTEHWRKKYREQKIDHKELDEHLAEQYQIHKKNLTYIDNDYNQRKKESDAELVKEYLEEIEAITNGWLSIYDQIDKRAKGQLDRLKEAKKYMPDDVYKDAEATIEKQKNIEYQKARLQDYKNSVEVARMKSELVEGEHDAYKTAVLKYFEWVEKQYRKDSREYLEALRMKVDLTKQALADLQAIQKRFQSKEDSLKEQYENDKKTLELTKDTNRTYLADMQALEKEYNTAISDLRKKAADEEKNRQLQELKAQIDLNEQKARLVTGNYYDMLLAAEIYTNKVIELYGTESKEYYDALEKRNQAHETAHEAMKDNTRSYAKMAKELFEGLKDSIAGAFDNIASGVGNAFADMILEGKNFGKSLQEVFKQFAKIAISEIMRVVVQLTIIRPLLMFLGPGAMPMPIPVAAASGGYIKGPGSSTSDSIPARLSNGEYVINAYKTKLFKPLLDLINYSPVNSIQKALNAYASSIRLPDIAFDTHTPRTNYATGGPVIGSPYMPPNANLESLEYLMAQMAAGIDKLNQKDYNIQIHAESDAIKYIREHKKREDIYNKAISI